MKIKIGNLEVEFNENKDYLKSEIIELKRIKTSLVNYSKYNIMYGKTMLEVEPENGITISSRFEHSVLVAYIAKQITNNIYNFFKDKISDEELFNLVKTKEILYAEIMGLCHDLGHTPFGHSGEKVLSNFVAKITKNDKLQTKQLLDNRLKYFGIEYEENQGHTKHYNGNISFSHNEQSVIEFYKFLIHEKLNMKYVSIKRLVDGILAHSTTRFLETPKDLIAQIIRQSDKIDYRNRDFEEIRSLLNLSNFSHEVINFSNIPYFQRLSIMAKSIATDALQIGYIDNNIPSLKTLKTFRKEYEPIIYLINKEGKRGLATGYHYERNEAIFNTLLNYYYKKFDSDRFPDKILLKREPLNNSQLNLRYIEKFTSSFIPEIEETKIEKFISYMCTFTNQKCYKVYNKLVKQRILFGKNFGILPIKSHDIEMQKKQQLEEKVNKEIAKRSGLGNITYDLQEIREITLQKDRKFISEKLNDIGKERIIKNYDKHQAENEKDFSLYALIMQLENLRELVLTKKDLKYNLKIEELITQGLEMLGTNVTSKSYFMEK